MADPKIKSARGTNQHNDAPGGAPLVERPISDLPAAPLEKDPYVESFTAPARDTRGHNSVSDEGLMARGESGSGKS